MYIPVLLGELVEREKRAEPGVLEVRGQVGVYLRDQVTPSLGEVVFYNVLQTLAELTTEAKDIVKKNSLQLGQFILHQPRTHTTNVSRASIRIYIAVIILSANTLYVILLLYC